MDRFFYTFIFALILIPAFFYILESDHDESGYFTIKLQTLVSTIICGSIGLGLLIGKAISLITNH